MNALILAGSRGPDDPMAQAAGVSHKALAPVAGIPMLLRVAEALKESGRFQRLYVCIEDPSVIFKVPGLEAMHRTRLLETIAAADSPAASVAAALKRIDVKQPLLVTTADHPLLTPAILGRFLELAPADCDLAVALAPADIVSAAYPGAIRTFYKLGGKRYSGCNLFLARSAKVADIAVYWRKLEAFRKQPMKLIWNIGPLFFLKVALGLMSAEGAFAHLSRKAGGVIKHVELPIAEAAIDVDKPADLELAERILSTRA